MQGKHRSRPRTSINLGMRGSSGGMHNGRSILGPVEGRISRALITIFNNFHALICGFSSCFLDGRFGVLTRSSKHPNLVPQP